MALPPFQTFLDRHAAELMRFLVALTGPDEAEDCFQETCLAALRALPAKQRAAVFLRVAAELPHSEVARVLDCSEEAARRSAHEGLKRLREEMT